MRKSNKAFTEEVFRRSERKLKKIEMKKKNVIAFGKALAACFSFFLILVAIPWGEVSEGTDENHGKEVVQAADLMEGIEAQEVEGKEIDDVFVQSQMQLAWELFGESALSNRKENVLISPLSINLALSMTSNGANGATREELEAVFASGYTLEELNEYMYTYINNLPSEDAYKLSIANSIWFRDDSDKIYVEPEFLQTNANYYGAQAYKKAFDDSTVNEINAWVNEHTDGMIDSIINEIQDEKVMYLMNAVCFDGKWKNAYTENDVKDGIFTSVSGSSQDVEFMTTTEWVYYLEDEWATGFVKQYQGNQYSFVALLPKDGSEVGIYNYIEVLKEENVFEELMKNQKKMEVFTQLPKFQYKYEASMEEILRQLGIEKAFNESEADFSKLGNSSKGNIYLAEIIHKTYIGVNEGGARAAAVTGVDVEMNSDFSNAPKVCLNRPFIYVIMDNETNLPVFIGTVMDMDKMEQ